MLDLVFSECVQLTIEESCYEKPSSHRKPMEVDKTVTRDMLSIDEQMDAHNPSNEAFEIGVLRVFLSLFSLAQSYELLFEASGDHNHCYCTVVHYCK